MKSAKKMIKYLLNSFTNNILLNNFLILFKLDKNWNRTLNPYLSYKVNKNKTIQEIAGYSEREEINEVLFKSKKNLIEEIEKSLTEQDRILDIGCGPGMYLSLLKNSNYKLYATDISEDMLALAKKNVPEASFYKGNFMNISIPVTFNFIYCIGVLVYIRKSEIDDFFKRIHNHLEPKGILYLNYPHAISIGDLLYKDISYIQYSPTIIEKLIAPYFEIIEHRHAFDNRNIKYYDEQPYKSLNPDTDRTYKNSYLLIAKKKL